jgi:hypothetical protein
MDFSKFKLEAYDLLGVILPGLIAISEVWVTLRGWHPFAVAVNRVGVSGFTLLIVFAFGLGNLVQELGDVMIKWAKGDRFFKRDRDKFWASTESHAVRAAIKDELGHEPASADAAYDYCLTRIQSRFAKREVFVATSDLCRSLFVLSLLAIVPLVRMTLVDEGLNAQSLLRFATCLVFLMTLSALAWKRMTRFRALSENTVFRSYLATASESTKGLQT